MSDDNGAYALDSRWVRRSFDRAARSFDGAAVLQAEVRSNLLDRLQFMAITARVVLDAGAGTGRAARALKVRYPKASVLALDFSFGMLQVAMRRQSWLRKFLPVNACAEQLPLADHSVDLIVSNLMLQWCDPDAVFAEFRRVMAPGGLLSFSTLGPDTLRELRVAWSKADARIHVNRFIDMHDLGDALVRSGFVSPVLDVERITLSYLDVHKVAEDLKATGARNANAGRPKGLTSLRTLDAMQKAYESYRREGRLPATYEVIFAHAWSPAGQKRDANPDGDLSVVSLEEIKRQLRARRG